MGESQRQPHLLPAYSHTGRHDEGLKPQQAPERPRRLGFLRVSRNRTLRSKIAKIIIADQKRSQAASARPQRQCRAGVRLIGKHSQAATK